MPLCSVHSQHVVYSTKVKSSSQLLLGSIAVLESYICLLNISTRVAIFIIEMSKCVGRHKNRYHDKVDCILQSIFICKPTTRQLTNDRKNTKTH